MQAKATNRYRPLLYAYGVFSMRKIILLIVFFLSLSLKFTGASLQSADLPTIKNMEAANPNDLPVQEKSQDLFKRFFLVVYPAAGPELNLKLKHEEEIKWTENHAMVIIDSKTARKTIRIGDPFFIVKNRSKLAEATLIKFFSSYLYGSVGLLRLKERVDWGTPGNGSAQLAFSKKKPSSDVLGSVTYLDKESSRQYLSMIKPHMPKHYGDVSLSAIKIFPPRSSEEYLLVAVEFFETKEKYESAQNSDDDRKDGSECTGFLFHQRAKEMVLLEQVPGLISIDGITDLDRDGVYEVLVYIGGCWGGQSEMHLFDGKVLSKSKRIMGSLGD